MKHITTALCATLAIGTAPAMAQDTTTAAGLDGAWESISCEVRPQPNQDGTMGSWYLTRTLTIEDGRIDAQFTTYAGPGCGFALQILSFGGSVTVQGASGVAEGAVEADLLIDDYVQFTPLAQPFADFLNSAETGTCGTGSWEVGTPQDVLETGCSVLGLPANSPTEEFEVLFAEGDYLFFGERPTDGSFITSPDKRPFALLAPLRRQ